MRKIDGDHVSADDRAKSEIPGETCSDQPDIDPIPCSSEQVPAAPEWIGNERNGVLSLDQQEYEVMGDVVSDRNWHKCQSEAPGDFQSGRSAGNRPTGDG